MPEYITEKETEAFWTIPKERMTLEEALQQAGFLVSEAMYKEKSAYREIRQLHSGTKIGEIDYVPGTNPTVFSLSKEIKIFSENVEDSGAIYLQDFLNAAKEDYKIV